MEHVHILAPLGIGVLLTIISRLDEVILTWKLEPYLAGRDTETRETIIAIAVGSISLMAFWANSLVFVVNLLIALSLYEVMWMRWVVSGVVAACLLALFYGALALVIRLEVRDIPEFVIKGLFVRTWLWFGQMVYNIIAFILIFIGLALSTEADSSAKIRFVLPWTDLSNHQSAEVTWPLDALIPPQLDFRIPSDFLDTPASDSAPTFAVGDICPISAKGYSVGNVQTVVRMCKGRAPLQGCRRQFP